MNESILGAIAFLLVVLISIGVVLVVQLQSLCWDLKIAREVLQGVLKLLRDRP